jgi:hypothetical protein
LHHVCWSTTGQKSHDQSQNQMKEIYAMSGQWKA